MVKPLNIRAQLNIPHTKVDARPKKSDSKPIFVLVSN